MNKSPNGKNNDEQNQKPFLPGGLWYILLAGAGLFGVLYWLSRAFSLTTEKYTFWVIGGANILIFLAIVVQALIYRRQWDAMNDGLKIERAKTNQRLRIADVRVENFEADKRPVFIVTIANDGLLPATGVRIHLEVELDTDKRLNWINDPVVTIPAGGKEHYFILSSSTLAQKHIDACNDNARLQVEGFFDYWPTGRVDFCYRYLPWQGERPKNVPQFVPCDFIPRLNTTISVKGFAIGIATVEAKGEVIRKGIAPSGDLTNVIIHGEPPNEPEASVEKKEEAEEQSDEAN